MKKVLLSFLLVGFTISLFAQARPGMPCPIDIKSNQGGGNCGPCQVKNDPNSILGAPTAKVTLSFVTSELTPGCIPRLLSVTDQTPETRKVLCGEGTIKSNINGVTEIEYCLYNNEQVLSGGTGNETNFFNQPNLTVELSYDCTNDGVNNPTTVTCAEAAPLPVKFKSISASRSKNNVSIKWQTAQEQNNKGFHLQRKTRGEWENVAFVLSLANGGNSSSDLSYSFNDVNTEKGISQYRVMQVDLDGRSSVSEIRSVRGEEMAASKMVVYPNPSLDGKVSVVFEEGNGNRNVVVSDMSGRRVKQYRNISSNNLIIEGLENGVYSIQVTDLTSSALSVEKVIVKKR